MGPHDLLRELPALDRLIAQPRAQDLARKFSREYIVGHCREILDELRQAIRQGRTLEPDALEHDAVSYTHLTLPTNREV